ncbi:hypothetical protein SEA_LISARA_53 [Arthrobacter phage LiSara]|uniref:Uncharacterized protein n=2 Tax=Laroyevirus TaxID=1982086 RepID=A0A0U4B499_9CAUD|nr:hypothetical protein FDH64_gp56 [Arthrobacter phage Laroye]YP_010082566.1 hypothetical protein KMD21_gp53 [Arthrobacter phage LiSara]ALY09581.1 hypothetical protein LAROYE_56 [Arthrobacter phage Laroye]ASR83637.1 hypothetical protein SEA_LISARA_53 [Arthrobacter phage LiSara]
MAATARIRYTPTKDLTIDVQGAVTEAEARAAAEGVLERNKYFFKAVITGIIGTGVMQYAVSASYEN